MRSLTILLLLATLAACGASKAPNGMTWEEFHAARFNLVVVHHDDSVVAGCQELGAVRGSSYDDIGVAKDRAAEQAVILGGDHLLFTRLWTEWAPYNPFRRLQDLHHADGVAYKCGG